MNKKGFIYYELIISFILISTVIYHLVIPLYHIFVSMENQKLTYEMKQNLTLNIILLENNEPLQLDSFYRLELEDDKLCVYWWDLYEEERKVCDKVWL